MWASGEEEVGTERTSVCKFVRQDMPVRKDAACGRNTEIEWQEMAAARIIWIP